MKIEPVTYICMFVYAMNFELPEIAKKWSFWTFQAQPASVRVISSIFLSKTCFRVISMIKMVILVQSKPISLIMKIKQLKIRKSEICTLHVYYS